MKIQLKGRRSASLTEGQQAHTARTLGAQMCLAGMLASAKGTPCYFVIVVYYCGAHSKRKTLMMSTYNLTMANPLDPPLNLLISV